MKIFQRYASRLATKITFGCNFFVFSFICRLVTSSILSCRCYYWINTAFSFSLLVLPLKYKLLFVNKIINSSNVCFSFPQISFHFAVDGIFRAEEQETYTAKVKTKINNKLKNAFSTIFRTLRKSSYIYSELVFFFAIILLPHIFILFPVNVDFIVFSEASYFFSFVDFS